MNDLPAWTDAFRERGWDPADEWLPIICSGGMSHKIELLGIYCRDPQVSAGWIIYPRTRPGGLPYILLSDANPRWTVIEPSEDRTHWVRRVTVTSPQNGSYIDTIEPLGADEDPGVAPQDWPETMMPPAQSYERGGQGSWVVSCPTCTATRRTSDLGAWLEQRLKDFRVSGVPVADVSLLP